MLTWSAVKALYPDANIIGYGFNLSPFIEGVRAHQAITERGFPAFLNGEVSSRGREVGVPTPINDATPRRSTRSRCPAR